MSKKKKIPVEKEPAPEAEPLSSDSEGSESVYDSDEYEESDYDSNEEISTDEEGEDDDDDDDDDDEEGDEFEDQGSSDEEDEILQKQLRKAKGNKKKGKKGEKEDTNDDDDDDSDDEVETLQLVESIPRQWTVTEPKPIKSAQSEKEISKYIHTDDLSSDDEDDDGIGNRIGRVPLHWYDEYDHIGYDSHGKKISKSAQDGDGDLLDKVIAQNDPSKKGKLTVYDALNAKEVEVTDRHLELIRRIQAGAFAHPEFDANPDYIDYFSGVDPEISGINSNRYEPKARFQPSKWEKMQVRKLLHRLQSGSINMDYLTGKVKDMNDISKKSQRKG